MCLAGQDLKHRTDKHQSCQLVIPREERFKGFEKTLVQKLEGFKGLLDFCSQETSVDGQMDTHFFFWTQGI